MVQYVISLWLCILLTFRAMDIAVFTLFHSRRRLGLFVLVVCACVCVRAGMGYMAGPHLDFVV